MTNKVMINVNHLYKKYKDVTAVNDLSLSIYEGELFSLLGVNGAGKSTFLKMLSCLVLPTSGEVTINGLDINKSRDDIKEIIAISTQETSISNNLTVKENLEFYASLVDEKSDSRKERISDIVKKFHLENYLNKKAKKLSGGWQRKLSIALALVNKPKILFLDEPTLGLDVISRRELWNIINSLKKDMTIILTTHYLEEAESLSDRIAIISSGKLKALGTSKEIISMSHKDNFEDAFISLATDGGNIDED